MGNFCGCGKLSCSSKARAAGSVTWSSCDRQRLNQVLLNILSNAIKYNVPGGSVTVRASTEGGLTLPEFDSFPPTRRTLRQFITACHELDGQVREIMIPNPDVV